jgi:hypothetical protein
VATLLCCSIPRLRTVLGAVLVAAVSAPAFGQATTLAALGARMTQLRFFESGNDIPAYVDRFAATSFEHARTRYINAELTFALAAPGRVVEFKVSCEYRSTTGQPLGNAEIQYRVQPDWTQVTHAQGWGWSNPGQWTEGTYRAICTSDGTTVAEGSFTIVKGASDFRSLDGKLTRIRVFESGGTLPAREDRRYAARFTSKDARYLNVELELGFAAPGAELVLPVSCLFIGQDGQIVANVEVRFEIKPAWKDAYSAQGWGSVQGGWWRPGKYRVACVGEGRLLDQMVIEVV